MFFCENKVLVQKTHVKKEKALEAMVAMVTRFTGNGLPPPLLGRTGTLGNS